jgi:hypothetical protein
MHITYTLFLGIYICTCKLFTVKRKTIPSSTDRPTRCTQSRINYTKNKQSHKIPKSYLQRNKFGPCRDNIFTHKIRIFYRFWCSIHV